LTNDHPHRRFDLPFQNIRWITRGLPEKRLAFAMSEGWSANGGFIVPIRVEETVEINARSARRLLNGNPRPAGVSVRPPPFADRIRLASAAIGRCMACNGPDYV
jgi:hypothetical protein